MKDKDVIGWGLIIYGLIHLFWIALTIKIIWALMYFAFSTIFFITWGLLVLTSEEKEKDLKE